jgi:hypothetical protein
MTHQEAYRIVSQSLPMLTPGESLALRSVASHESNYGLGWKGAGVGSNNMGAITRKPNADGSCPVDSFPYGDSKRSGAGGEGGKLETYQTCFRRYATPAAGFQGLRDVLFGQRPAVKAGAAKSLEAVATAMRESSYYLGTAATKAEQIEAYRSALDRNARAIVKATGEAWPWVDVSGGGGLGAVAAVATLATGAFMLLKARRG